MGNQSPVELKTFWLFLIFRICQAQQSTNFMVGLNERLQVFEICNIRLTAEFGTSDIELIFVPVTLVDIKVRSEWYTHNTNNSRIHLWKTPINDVTLGFPFQLRKEICTLDLVLYL